MNQMLMLMTLSLCLTPCSPISTHIYSSSMQCGSLTAIYTPSNTAPLDKTMRMALSYKGAFNSQPKILVMVNSIVDTNNNSFYNISVVPFTDNSNATILTFYESSDSVYISLLKVSYLAFHKSNFPNIYQTQLWANLSNPSFTSFFFELDSQFLIEEDSTLLCGWYGIKNFNLVLTPVTLSVECKRYNATQIDIFIIFSGSQTTPDGGIRFNFLAFNNNNHWRITSGILQSSNWSQGAAIPSTLIRYNSFIHLTSIATANSKPTAVLSDDLSSISTSYQYNTARFFYYVVEFLQDTFSLAGVVQMDFVEFVFWTSNLTFRFRNLPLGSDEYNFQVSNTKDCLVQKQGGDLMTSFTYENCDAQLGYLNYSWVSNGIIYLGSTKIPDFREYYGCSVIPVQKEIYTLAALVLQYGYLALFILCLSCSKIIAAESIFIVQVAFYSLIPIQISNWSYSSLTQMRMVSGYNPFFSDLPQGPLSTNYSLLGIHSNFISNLNAMLLVFIFCPVLFILLKGTAKLCQNKNWIWEERLSRYSNACIRELPLTLLLFNCFNIYVSLTVDIQTLRGSYPLSTCIGLVLGLAPLAVAVLFLLYRHRFSQYQVELNDIEKIGCLEVSTSLKIRNLYPVVLVSEFVLNPIILSVELFAAYSLFVAVGLSLSYFCYVLFVTPYKSKCLNVRLIINRVLILTILGVQLSYQQTQANQLRSPGTFLQMPLGVLVPLAIGLIVNFSCYFVNLNTVLRRNDSINVNKVMKRTDGQAIPAPTVSRGLTHHISEYTSVYRRYKQREAILDKQVADQQAKLRQKLKNGTILDDSDRIAMRNLQN